MQLERWPIQELSSRPGSLQEREVNHLEQEKIMLATGLSEEESKLQRGSGAQSLRVTVEPSASFPRPRRRPSQQYASLHSNPASRAPGHRILGRSCRQQGQAEGHPNAVRRRHRSTSCFVLLSSSSLLIHPLSTFTADAMTTGRRTAPVPQLTCVGSACRRYGDRVQVVQCTNMGDDGTGNVQWKVSPALVLPKRRVSHR